MATEIFNTENIEEQMTTVMADDLTIKGTISFKTSLMIKGSLEGEVRSSGTLVVGETAKLKAAITTNSLISQGEIQGDVTASEQVVLKSTSVHNGKITTPNIIVESGSIFNGSCVMQRVKSEPPQEEGAVEEKASVEETPTPEPSEEKPQAENSEAVGQPDKTGMGGGATNPSGLLS